MFVPNEKTIQFYKEFCEKYPDKKDEYEPYSDVTYKNKPLYFKTKYGIVRSTPYQMMKGVFPGIRSASNPTEYFITKAKLVHGDKYDYSNTVNNNKGDCVTITCRIHGPFLQQKSNHLFGQGCRKCRLEKRKYSIEDLVSKYKIIHRDFYNYDNTKYLDRNPEYINITCPIHGEFIQHYYSHLKGCGCQKCSNELKKINYSYLYKEKTNIRCDLYVMRIFNDEEDFYKIGISRKLKKRKEDFEKYYKTELILSKNLNLQEAHNTEQFLLNMLYKNTYIPKIKFSGDGECVNNISLQTINKLLTFKSKFYESIK